MSTRPTALAIARAMLTTPVSRFGMLERMPLCTRLSAEANCELVDLMLGKGLNSHWTVERLADELEDEATFYIACDMAKRRPLIHGWFMTRATTLSAQPTSLRGIERPLWPSIGRLAEGLDVSGEGLWRLTRSASWQRRAPLGEQHYRYELLPKRTGGWRLLEVPHPYLRELQRKLLHELVAQVPPHEAACAYVRGRSVVDHARAHAGQAVLLKFDLQDFFATVRASRVHATFVAFGYSRAVARELMALCTTATPEPVLERLRADGGLTWAQARRFRDAHLPQGAPTSAALANLCAFRLDTRIAGLAQALGARYTRYADDIVLSGDASLRRWADRIAVRVAGFALDEGFALNHRKTRCVTASRRQQVANIVVNAKPNLPRDEFDRLKATLHRCVTQGPSTQNRAGVPQWEQHLRGRVAWAAQINADKAQRLQRLLERIDWSA
ncbi:MAG: reverse transcriptase family protein [Burkholderiaceae bacterium]